MVTPKYKGKIGNFGGNAKLSNIGYSRKTQSVMYTHTHINIVKILLTSTLRAIM